MRQVLGRIAGIHCLCLLVVGVGCSEEIVPMTPEEYAQEACLPLPDDTLDDDATWGDFEKAIGEKIMKFKRLGPPAELQDWHNIRRQSLEAFQTAVKRQDSNHLIANPFVLFADPALMAVVLSMEGLEENLDHESRSLLVKAGCDIKSPA